MNFSGKNINIIFLEVFEFRENRHSEGCTFLVGVNEPHLYACVENL
jgi:hypothetical protein